MLSRHHLRIALLTAVAIASAPACSPADPDTPSDQPDPALPDPPPAPYSAAELDALAHSDELLYRRFPFAFAPTCADGRYVTMSDGVGVALHYYYPEGFDPARDKAPAALIETWYGREGEAVLEALSLYAGRGFVVVIQDSRGFGASAGAQAAYMSARVRLDEREVQRAVAAEPWSTGDVVTVGLSLSGTLAEFGNTSGSGVVRASVIRSADYDQYALNLFPGGVPNTNMLEGVVEIVHSADGGACVEDPAACAELGVALVGDTDFSGLRAALPDHHGNAAPEMLVGAEFKDDPFGAGGWGDFDLTARFGDIDTAAIPTRMSTSWMDGTTTESALRRYTATSGPVELVISSTEHLGSLESDPFVREPFGRANPTPEESFGADVAFVERVLRGENIGRSVRYKVLGTDVWKRTEAWPPAGVERTVLYPTGGALEHEAFKSRHTRTYAVDPQASTGPFNRWASQMGGPIFYADPRVGGERLGFVSAPWPQDLELVGTAEVCLDLATDQTDGIVIAYLEDIAPDGTRTYLTEGELRLIHRGAHGTGCDDAAGPARGFTRAESKAVVPGQSMSLAISFLPTAARLRQGHRLRLSFAGTDSGTFPMLTAAAPVWTVGLGGDHPSSLALPLRPWTED